ncbi:glycosyltransferase family protein (DUF23) [Tasmannia lanceolata]|uniref:glycosyltransferase family protein (DUF23) n=1 Tax=Tasmannia lanceolata TaxID=3420 RepID=UPI004062C0DF
MRRKIKNGVFSLITCFLFFATFSHHLFQNFSLDREIPTVLSPIRTHQNLQNPTLALQEQHLIGPYRTPISDPPDSILFPDWEILLVLLNSDHIESGQAYSCLFPTGVISPATFSGILPWSGNRTTFRCSLPHQLRRILPFYKPLLIPSAGIRPNWPENTTDWPELFRWSFLVYESISTEDDVILFAKGVNNRKAMNFPASELRCVFSSGEKTAVISSSQEVFRCRNPDPILTGGGDIKITLEIFGGANSACVVPSVAYYAQHMRRLAGHERKSLLCACTMVYNVGKFLKEWVIYHSRIGVERFVLYDNGSDDDVAEVVKKLLEDGFDLTRVLWPWPKTQEAGFSHSATYFKESCTWMMYIDIDEFVFSPSWVNASHPSKHMLTSLLPKHPSSSSSFLSLPSSEPLISGSLLSSSSSSSSLSLLSSEQSISRSIGQVSIRCLEFGPSNQKSHPKEGVTQGYTCRRRNEERHKSIVLLDGIDSSLTNVIHHFKLKPEYRTKTLSKNEVVVNHYKYQAWSEFKTKFRRRVSAYVIDWTQAVNLGSKDRAPGLGHIPIEPKGWGKKFCEVNDTGLREVSRRWFGLESPTGERMAWEDE